MFEEKLSLRSLPARLVQLWNKWEILGLVLLSLFLQILLVVFGSRRKYITKIWIRILVWSTYLSADMVASVALGVLSRSQGVSMDSSATPDNSIKAFWAPFLLLHLGGPDTITAFSVEDNELWLRHFLGLAVHVGVAFYVFIKSWDTTALTLIAIPMFIAGSIKYGERTWALKSASTKHIRDSLLSASPSLRLDTKEIIVVPRGHYIPITNYLHQAYYLFKMSMYHFQNLILSFSELKDSHSIVSRQSSKEAFELEEVELGFIYDRLYTKSPLVYSRSGIFLRSVTFLSSVISLLIFSIILDKHAFSIVNIATTYTLLAGALVLEIYSFFYLIFSDKTMIWLAKYTSPPANPIGRAIYSLHACLTDGKRWSGSMGQYNLISSSLKNKIPKWSKFFGIDEMINHMYKTLNPVSDDIKDLIFKQLLSKGNEIIEHLHIDNDNKRNELVAQRGDGVLTRMQKFDEFKWSTIDVEFSHSLLMWHIATDLCYSGDREEVKKLPPQYKISKWLSDYMFYLLVIRPYMLPKGIGDIRSRYKDTCEEINRFFQKNKEKSSQKISYTEEKAGFQLLKMKHAILEDIIATPIDTTPTIPGAYGSSKYMLVHGCMLAQQLQKLESDEKWKMISEVWVEMLAYAACRCEWKEHAQQLKSGGELLTHVCLLMAHLGLSQQYQEVLVN